MISAKMPLWSWPEGFIIAGIALDAFGTVSTSVLIAGKENIHHAEI